MLSLLEVHTNRISSIADEYFAATPALTQLDLHGNQLASLPPSLLRCARLLSLQAHENELVRVPAGPWPKELENLFLHDNPGLSRLPWALTALMRAKRVNLAKLPLDADADAVADALRCTCAAASGGIFWGKDGRKTPA